MESFGFSNLEALLGFLFYMMKAIYLSNELNLLLHNSCTFLQKLVIPFGPYFCISFTEVENHFSKIAGLFVVPIVDMLNKHWTFKVSWLLAVSHIVILS